MTYRGSLKHKNRPSTGMKGTLCPEWTHSAAAQGFAGDPFQHAWPQTQAHQLFENATVWDEQRRYATGQGIAFEAKPTGDGTWHGYPIPWESVPPTIIDQWLTQGRVTRKQIKLYKHVPKDSIRWALDGSDT